MHTTPVVLFAALLSIGLANDPTLVPPPLGDPGNLLAGPRIGDTRPTTLVERTFDGALIPVEGDPAVAALRLVDLAPAQDAALDELLTRKLLAFDSAVIDNLDLVGNLQSLLTSSDRAQAMETMRRIRAEFGDIMRSGTLIDDMTPHLDAGQLTRARKLLAEYESAQRQALQASTDRVLPDRALNRQMRLRAFGRSLAESIERQTLLAQERFDELTDLLQLTPEQNTAVQAILQDAGLRRLRGEERSGGAGAFAKLRDVLDANQLRTLRRELRPR